MVFSWINALGLHFSSPQNWAFVHYKLLTRKRVGRRFVDPFSFCKFAAVFLNTKTLIEKNIDMAKDAEELRMILDMAANGGKMQAQNEMLLEKLAKKENENNELRERLAKKTQECDEKDRRIEELEAKLACGIPAGNVDAGSQGAFFMVDEFYYALSWLKTVKYVGSLDSDGRKSASHFIHQTLPDGISIQFVKKVDELTKLEGPQNKRLADAMEEVAKRPTTQNNVYPQNGSTANVGCDIPNAEFKVLPSAPGTPVQQSSLEGGPDYE